MQMRKSKIICTIGPASESSEKIKTLIRSGMNAARLNFSHGNHAYYSRVIQVIREESKKLNTPVAVLQDLQGIKIRVGHVQQGSIILRKGAEVFLSNGTGLSTETQLFISYPELLKDAQKGGRVLFDDGLIQGHVLSKTRNAVILKITEGGILKDRKGVNFPDMKTTAHSFTEKDRQDLAFGLKINVDYAALSFVRNAGDVRVVKQWLSKRKTELPLIAKIEKPEALDDIDNILQEADGIMIARGDLGVEISPEKVPLVQKELIRKANQMGKIVITATQMLESMTGHSRPTRAEATDVANAVLDGTDALMLSAETAVGKYPVESCRMMDRIIRYTESHAVGQGNAAHSEQHDDKAVSAKNKLSGQRLVLSRNRASDFSWAVAEAACAAAEDIRAKSVIAFTQSGFTARLVSRFRPKVPIIAFTPNPAVVARLALYWGVKPAVIRPLSNTDEMIREVEKSLLRNKTVRKGDRIVITAGSPLLTRGKTNLLKLHTIGE